MLRLSILAGCMVCAATALGQTSRTGGTTTSGAFGTRTIGGGTTASQSTFSNTNTSQGSSGGSNTGMNSGMTGGASGSSGGTSTGLGARPSAGFALGTTAANAEQRNGQFIGADATDAGNLRSNQQQGQNQMSGLNSLFGPQGAFSQMARQNQQGQNQNQNQRGRTQLRFPIKADITMKNAVASPTSVSRQFETRLKKLPVLEKTAKIQVTMQGRKAVLTGTVASDRDRSLAAGLAMLEPGISAVQNDLVVAEPAESEELPAPRN